MNTSLKLADALRFLLDCLAEGAEYSKAERLTVRKHKVDVNALRAAYDAEMQPRA